MDDTTPRKLEPKEALAAPAGNRTWVIAAVMAMMFMIAIEGTIVATAMPTIVGELGGFDLFSWVFTAYLLTQAVTIPIYGRLADLYGRKRILYRRHGGVPRGVADVRPVVGHGAAHRVSRAARGSAPAR